MGRTSKLLSQIKQLGGIGLPSNTSSLPSKTGSDASGRRYSNAEWQSLANRNYVAPKPRTMSQSLDLTQLITYLRPSHERSVSIVQDAERLRALAPELNQAEEVIVSSIMSPNDLQDTDPTIYIDEMPELSQPIKDNIELLLHEFFNNEFHLGKKLRTWCKESLFRSGAVPVFLLPEGTLTRMVGNQSAGKENFSMNREYSDKSFLEQLTKEIYTPQVSTPRKKKDHISISNKNPKKVSDDILLGAESYVRSKLDLSKDKTTESVFKSFGLAGFESITARIVTELEEGDTLFLSENPEVLRFGSKIRDYQKNKIGKDLLKLYENTPESKSKTIVMGSQAEENIVDLLSYTNDDDKHTSHPFVIELPAEAVIPICIPGDPKRKLGYFILIDAFGHPIEASKYLIAANGCTTSGRIEASYAAMFGNKPTTGGIQTSSFSTLNRFGTPWDLQQNAVANVFDYVLDEMIKQKLSNVGLHEVDLGTHTSISTCMFYRLLEKKRTSLVFVPEELVTYFAFEYRDDGTGKSKLEDIMYILSIRTTLIVANMLAAMRNSIARKEITITVDEKEINAEALLDEVSQAMTEKYKMSLSSDPTQIAQAINNQNTTIKLEGTNAPGFNIQATDSQTNVVKTDESLFDFLNSAMGNQIGVPSSVINQLSEAEYARSVATTNLFFAKATINKQEIVCEHSEKLIQTFIKFSPELKTKMLKCLKSGTTKQKDDEDVIIPNTTTDVNQPTDQDVTKLFFKILNSIKVKLPAPNIAPDKAQYEVFSDYLRLIDELTNTLLPQELTGTDSELSDTFNAIKAHYKTKLVQEYAIGSGMDGVFNVDSLEEFITKEGENISKLIRIVRNTKMGLDKDKTAETTEPKPEGEDVSGDMGDTGSSDMGTSESPWL